MIEQRLQSAAFGELASDLIGNGRAIRFCQRGRSMTPNLSAGEILTVEPTKRPPNGVEKI